MTPPYIAQPDDGLVVVPSNPTPNGDLHVGHVAGPFLGADVLRRAALSRGRNAATVLGTAWQNTHVLIAARRQGREYFDLAAENAERIERSFAAAGVEYDVFLRHGDIPDIERATRTAVERLIQAGTVVVREGRAHHCPKCDAWCFQGGVDGRCPHCGSSDAYGIDCEGCAVFHDDAELLDAHCSACGTPTELRPLRRAYLDLERFRGFFEDYFASVRLAPPVQAYAQQTLARSLPSVAVSFIGELGFSMGDLLPGQRIYPSVELAPRYTVMLQRLRAATADSIWAEPETAMLFGQDNAFERVFLFPAVLSALVDERAPLPATMHLSYFSLLDGLKFSTSRGHLVSVHDLVAAHGLDVSRLHLAAGRPETGPTVFSMSEVPGSVAERTVRVLRSWAQTGDPTYDHGLAHVTPGPHALGHLDGVRRAEADLDRALRPATLSCVEAADAVVRLAAAVAGPGATDPALCQAALRPLTGLAGALIPETAAMLRDRFGTEFAATESPG